jgi:ribosomal protein S1
MSEDVATNAPSSIDDLTAGMTVNGTVKRLELYGAFVDIGIGKDALLHISQLGKPNVRNVGDVVNVDDKITAFVLKVDKGAGRIALSLEQPPDMTWDDLKEGQAVTGKVVRIEKFGVFVDIGAERPGMVHVSELANDYVKAPSDVVSVGQEVEARIIRINRKKRQIDLTMKSEADIVESYNDEEVEEMPTAMALAFRRAMAEQDETDAQRAAREKNDRRKIRDQQEDILSRTLREHSGQ